MGKNSSKNVALWEKAITMSEESVCWYQITKNPKGDDKPSHIIQLQTNGSFHFNGSEMEYINGEKFYIPWLTTNQSDLVTLMEKIYGITHKYPTNLWFNKAPNNLIDPLSTLLRVIKGDSDVRDMIDSDEEFIEIYTMDFGDPKTPLMRIPEGIPLTNES